jgi:hypothetical protein
MNAKKMRLRACALARKKFGIGHGMWYARRGAYCAREAVTYGVSRKELLPPAPRWMSSYLRIPAGWGYSDTCRIPRQSWVEPKSNVGDVMQYD